MTLSEKVKQELKVVEALPEPKLPWRQRWQNHSDALSTLFGMLAALWLTCGYMVATWIAGYYGYIVWAGGIMIGYGMAIWRANL